MSFGKVRASFFIIMKTEDLLSLPLEERAKQKAEVKWEKGCMGLAVFPATFIIAKVGAGNFSESGATILVLTAIGSLFYSIYCFCSRKSEQVKTIRDAKRELSRSRHLAEEEKLQTLLNERLKELSVLHGDCDKQIKIADTTKIESYILAYGKGKWLVIDNKEINFSDIIDLSVQDEQEVEKGRMRAVTTTDTSNMVGRAVVGGVLAGSTGAAIGGATARKDTTFIQGNDKVVHNYTAIVNLNSLSNPIISVNIGSDASVANEVKALFNVILNSK